MSHLFMCNYYISLVAFICMTPSDFHPGTNMEVLRDGAFTNYSSVARAAIAGKSCFSSKFCWMGLLNRQAFAHAGRSGQ